MNTGVLSFFLAFSFLETIVYTFTWFPLFACNHLEKPWRGIAFHLAVNGCTIIVEMIGQRGLVFIFHDSSGIGLTLAP